MKRLKRMLLNRMLLNCMLSNHVSLNSMTINHRSIAKSNHPSALLRDSCFECASNIRVKTICIALLSVFLLAAFDAYAQTHPRTHPPKHPQPQAPAQTAEQPTVIIYRCTDAMGNLTLQNGQPCPKGSTQEIRKVAALPMQNPSHAAAAAPPAHEKTASDKAATEPTPAPAAAPAAAERQPPPPLFQCKTWDDRDYYGDTGEPPAVCAPLDTVGIDGSNTLASGKACEMRQDTCTPIPADQLCVSWKRRIDEAAFRWKFAGGKNDERKAEYEKLSNTYRQSACVASP